jgi:hypothetical protein
MNLKLQAGIILNPAIWKYDIDDENVYFSNSVMVKRVPQSECMINLDRLEQGGGSVFFKDEGMWDTMEPTKLRLKETGYTAIRLKGEEHECWIDEKYHKMFKKYDWENNGGTYVRVRHPATCEIEAIVLTIRRNVKPEPAEQETEN